MCELRFPASEPLFVFSLSGSEDLQSLSEAVLWRRIGVQVFTRPLANEQQ